MTKRALYAVIVGGIDITSRLDPYLISLDVTDNVGTHSDTVSLVLDDTDGRIVLPVKGDPIVVAIGWDAPREVFRGTVDEVRSSGGRQGRTVNVRGKGLDTTDKAKQPQQRHFDNKSIEDMLSEAGQAAGVTTIDVDPALGSIVREYVDMRDESFAHFGERLSREIGGNFRIKGDRAEMSLRNGAYTTFVVAEWGRNLHTWDISPALGRPAFDDAGARWYDRKEAVWKDTSASVDTDVAAKHWPRYTNANEDEAKQRTKSDKATSERDAGEGSVTIEGDPAAIPDGLCQVVGARPGVDGTYRIDSVQHAYSRSGFVTTLSLKQPQDGAGTDSR